MSDRLIGLLNEVWITSGAKGFEAIARKVGKSPKTISRWAKEGVSDPHKSYRLALACGCSDKQALAIASECLQGRIKEPA